jgi:chorismate mutase
MMVRGIRGATTVKENSAEQIFEATKELLHEIVRANEIHPEEIASVIATLSVDLDAAYPALAIRSLTGWELVPIMCAIEIPVPGSVSHCIRVMIHVNTAKSQSEIQHIYMREAVSLRPDLVTRSTS